MRGLVLALAVLVGGMAVAPPQVEAHSRSRFSRQRFEGPRERAQRLQRERARRDLLRALQQLQGNGNHHGRR